MVSDHSLRKFILTLALAGVACGLASPASDAPAPVPLGETDSAPTTSAPALTVHQLQNSKYQLGATDDSTVVQLTDGKFQRGTDTTTLDYAYIALTRFAAIGDLTSDGVDEAAAMFLENYGGTGNFGLLAIYTNVNGLPAFLTSTMIDDRPMVNSVSIENGQVFLDAVVHAFDDAACCPELSTARRYALVNNQLRLTNYATKTPAGAERIVEISSPANGVEASGSVQVSGSVSIAPFENNLTYSVFDDAGNQIALGAMTVTAPGQGALGTFNGTVSLAGVPAGTSIYLEIQDQSAADGSLLAMDAVSIIVK